MSSEERLLVKPIRDLIFKKDEEGALNLINKNPEYIHYITMAGGTLLHDTATHDCLELAKVLIQMGINVGIESKRTGNALSNANSIRMAEYLIGKGLKINTELNVESSNPLFRAITNEDVQMVQFWIDQEIKQEINPEFTNRLLELAWERAELLSRTNIMELLKTHFKYKEKDDVEIKKTPFDFELLYNEIKQAIKNAFIQTINTTDGKIYSFAFSSDFRPEYVGIYANTEEYYEQTSEVGTEPSFVYRFNIEEWGIVYEGNEFNSISKKLGEYLQQSCDREFLKNFQKDIFELYLNVMKKLKEENFFLIHYNYPILLFFYIRDYYSTEDIIKNALLLNKEQDLEDFIKNINQIY